MAIFLLACDGNAQQKNQFKSAKLTTTYNKDVVRYDFNDLNAFENQSDNIIRDLATTSQGHPADVPCTVTISMEVSVTVSGNAGVVGGSVVVTVSGSITAGCADAVQAGKDLRKKLIAMAQG